MLMIMMLFLRCIIIMMMTNIIIKMHIWEVYVLSMQKVRFAEEKTEELVGKSDVFKEQFGDQRFVVHCGELRLRLQANLVDDPQPEHLDNVCLFLRN